MGPLAVAANLYIQSLKFNPIYLVSDPGQKWKLLEIFLAALTPFLGGAVFLGCVFLKSNKTFGRVYFADLAGSGLSGLVFLGAMYLLNPVNLIAAPLALWLAACLAWTFIPVAVGRAFLRARRPRRVRRPFPAGPGARPAAPRGQRLQGRVLCAAAAGSEEGYESASPFGFLEAYTTSYLHFAPGLSDNAAFNLPEMPANAYMGLYIHFDGPIGVMRLLSPKEGAYFRYLPMYLPSVVKKDPKVFVAQFGGGISTEVALAAGAKDVTVAEGNRAILERSAATCSRNSPATSSARRMSSTTKAATSWPRPGEFDVVDLSLADFTGLSNPGGFAVVEKFPYSQEAMQSYLTPSRPGASCGHHLEQGGAAEVGAAPLYDDGRGGAGDRRRQNVEGFLRRFDLPVHRHRAYKRGGFTEDEVKALRDHTRAMSFDEIYSPGFFYDCAENDRVLKDYDGQFSSSPQNGPPAATPGRPGGQASGGHQSHEHHLLDQALHGGASTVK